MLSAHKIFYYNYSTLNMIVSISNIINLNESEPVLFIWFNPFRSLFLLFKFNANVWVYSTQLCTLVKSIGPRETVAWFTNPQLIIQ
jgi:hypothetical protein